MQNNVAALNRGNYTPAAKEKHLVHYKAEIPRFNKKTGRQESHPEIIKTGLKMFPSVKRELEKQGYVIEILWHPEGKYNTPLQPAPVAERDAEIAALMAERDAEIAALKAELAKLELKGKADQAQDAAAKESEKPAGESTDDEAAPEKKAEPAKKEPKAAAKTARKK